MHDEDSKTQDGLSLRLSGAPTMKIRPGYGTLGLGVDENVSSYF